MCVCVCMCVYVCVCVCVFVCVPTCSATNVRSAQSYCLLAHQNFETMRSLFALVPFDFSQAVIFICFTYAVTGANVGLGYHTARHLAIAGASVVMGVRSVEKGEAAMNEILDELREGGREAVHMGVVELDLTSLASVRAFADEVKRRYHRIDVLINNAGVMDTASEKKLTADGHEVQDGRDCADRNCACVSANRWGSRTYVSCACAGGRVVGRSCTWVSIIWAIFCSHRCCCHPCPNADASSTIPV